MRAAGRVEVAGGTQGRTMLVPHPPASSRSSLTDPGGSLSQSLPGPEWAWLCEATRQDPAWSQLTRLCFFLSLLSPLLFLLAQQRPLEVKGAHRARGPGLLTSGAHD